MHIKTPWWSETGLVRWLRIAGEHPVRTWLALSSLLIALKGPGDGSPGGGPNRLDGLDLGKEPNAPYHGRLLSQGSRPSACDLGAALLAARPLPGLERGVDPNESDPQRAGSPTEPPRGT